MNIPANAVEAGVKFVMHESGSRAVEDYVRKFLEATAPHIALGGTVSIPTLNSGLSPAALCRANAWTVGTRLIGDEGHGPAVIEITAIGESCVLAKRISPNAGSESSWSLSCREWVAVAA